MRIGIPYETHRHEHRVGLTPLGVSRLRGLGAEVFVQHDAGCEGHFTEQNYVEAGAAIVHDRDEIYGRPDLVCKVGTVTEEEARMTRPGAAISGFMHVAVMPREALRALVDRKVTLLGWEQVEDDQGAHPVRRALSEIAGRMAVQWAAHLLQFEAGGRGIILGNVPGVAPATVVILGAGAVGWSAARVALALNAHVIVLDADMARLRRALEHGCGHAVTAVASAKCFRRFIPIADALITAATVPGGRAPFLVSEDLVRRMKQGSVILDLAVDEGGCVETSRPTTLDNPTYKVHGVTHFCVPNMTANAPRTASRALTLASVPFLERIAMRGLDAALREDPGLARGICLYRGHVLHDVAAQALGVPRARLEDVLEG